MVRLRFAQQLGIALGVLALSACAHVARYERGALARPDMTAEDAAGPAERHAISVREGASRGGAVAESGCGCN
jgi:hypothetical protein